MTSAIYMEKEPSKAVSETIEFNQAEIWEAAHVAALQAMPVCLAQGIQTNLAKQIDLLTDAIHEMIRRAVDEGQIGSIENVEV